MIQKHLVSIWIHPLTSTDTSFNTLKQFSSSIANGLDIPIDCSSASWFQLTIYYEKILDYVYTIFLLCVHHFRSLIPYLLPRTPCTLVGFTIPGSGLEMKCVALCSFTWTLEVNTLHYGLQQKWHVEFFNEVAIFKT